MDEPAAGVGHQFSLFEAERASVALSHAEACAVCPVRHTALCRTLDDERVKELGAISSYRRFGQREPIFDEGEVRTHCFNVVSGLVRLYKLTVEGRMQVTGFLLPGDFMGLPITGRLICSADAIGPTVLCCFPLRPLQRLLGRYPELYVSIVGVLGREFLEAQTHMLWLGRKPAEARLASFLLDFGQRNARAGGHRDRFLLPMGRGDIANYLGLAVETVSRVFTRLKDQGVIELPLAERVRLIDRGRLAELAEKG